MTKILIFASSIVWICLCNQSIVNKQPDKKDILVNIAFQDSFKNDTVSLKINHVLIVDNMILNSSITGLTILRLDVIRLNNDTFKIDFLKEYKYCPSSDKINLMLKLNGKISRFTIDWHKGKYVGFGKNNDNTFNLNQQREPFMYE